MVDYPPGIIPLISPADPLTTSRYTTFTYELLDRDGNLKGPLDGVVGGSVTWKRDALIKGGGTMRLTDLGQDIDWLNDRFRISMTVNGVTWPLGVWIPTAPTALWDGPSRVWDVELHDLLVVLDEDKVLQTTLANTGEDVLDYVVALIQSAGETFISATDIGATVTAPLTWMVGTSKLRIINDLLNASGYFPLRVNRDGAFLMEPYVQPAQRPYAYEFLDGPNSIYASAFSHTLDNFSVPNRVIATTNGDSENEGFVASAENDDPDSDYSYSNRGRWIALFYENVEAVTETALATWCRRKLADWSSPGASEKFSFMPVPIDIYDAARFRNQYAGLDMRVTIESVTIPLDGLALATADVRGVSAVTTTTGSAVWEV